MNFSDQVALARDGVDKPDRFVQRSDGPHIIIFDAKGKPFHIGVKPKFHPHPMHGLKARLLAVSNALYNRIDYRDGGSFAEPHTSRHAGWKP